MIKIKVCGMRNSHNIDQLIKTRPDFIGFIFYPESKRYVGQEPPMQIFNIPSSIKKVGVFVNEDPEKIIDTGRRYRLNCIQMHGSESPSDCERIRIAGFTLLKAFGVDASTNFNELNPFVPVTDYFLFDTKTELHGGSGRKFEWEKLSEYTGRVPFFLSGGISESDAAFIRSIHHPALYGIDINSKFELTPGIKDVQKIYSFIHEIRSDNN